MSVFAGICSFDGAVNEIGVAARPGGAANDWHCLGFYDSVRSGVCDNRCCDRWGRDGVGLL